MGALANAMDPKLGGAQKIIPTQLDRSEVMVHLTNYAINKANPNFEETGVQMVNLRKSEYPASVVELRQTTHV